MENNSKITIIGGTGKVGRLQLDNTKRAIMFQIRKQLGHSSIKQR